MPPETRFRLTVCAAMGALGVGVACGILMSALVTPGSEPFWNWTYYAFEAIRFALILSVPPSVMMGMLAAALLATFSDRLRAAAAALWTVWAIMPLIILWSMLQMLSYSHHWSFDFGPGVDKLPVWTIEPLRFASSDWWLLLILLAFAWCYRLAYTHTFVHLQNLRHVRCLTCGYDVHSIRGKICPECGSPFSLGGHRR